jgi:hypothetical protein
MMGPSRKTRRLYWVAVGLGAASVVVVLWIVLFQPRAKSDFPPTFQITQKVTTLIGRKAEPFALKDDQGTLRRVVPGQGRAIGLIMHMGIL